LLFFAHEGFSSAIPAKRVFPLPYIPRPYEPPGLLFSPWSFEGREEFFLTNYMYTSPAGKLALPLCLLSFPDVGFFFSSGRTSGDGGHTPLVSQKIFFFLRRSAFQERWSFSFSPRQGALVLWRRRTFVNDFPLPASPAPTDPPSASLGETLFSLPQLAPLFSSILRTYLVLLFFSCGNFFFPSISANIFFLKGSPLFPNFFFLSATASLQVAGSVFQRFPFPPSDCFGFFFGHASFNESFLFELSRGRPLSGVFFLPHSAYRPASPVNSLTANGFVSCGLVLSFSVPQILRRDLGPIDPAFSWTIWNFFPFFSGLDVPFLWNSPLPPWSIPSLDRTPFLISAFSLKTPDSGFSPLSSFRGTSIEPWHCADPFTFVRPA